MARYSVEPGWRDNLRGPIGEALLKLGEQVLEEAARMAPVDTGRLTASLHVGAREVIYNLAEDGRSIAVGSAVPYAGYVEEGTRRQPAEPYLRPALFRQREVQT